MDERLQKALDFSNYMITLNNQKRVLKQQYQENIIHYYNGGQFTVTQELITFLNMLVDRDSADQLVLIDDNETPVLINSGEEFLEQLLHTYFTVTNQYYLDYKDLMSRRSVPKLVDYDD